MARGSDKRPQRPAEGRTGRSFRADRDRRPERTTGRDRPARRDAAPAEDKLIRVAGLPSVVELFRGGPERVERLYFEAEHRPKTQAWCAELARRHKVFRQLRPEEMQRVAGTAMHGGIVALARPRPIRLLDPNTAEAWASEGKPLLILDGVGNPQNIGAIARTAAFYGLSRLVISDHPAQSSLSDASYRVAKGGLEWIDVYRAERLPDVLRRLSAGYQVVGTAVERATTPERLARTGKPIALVMGNEENGLPPATLAACSSIIALSGSGRVQSLNVSAAAAILIHDLLRRA